MKDYTVCVVTYVEVRVEDEKSAHDDAETLVQNALEAREVAYAGTTVGPVTCVGGDDDIATDLMHETGLPYETCETFVNGLTKEQRDGLDAQQMAEMIEAKL